MDDASELDDIIASRRLTVMFQPIVQCRDYAIHGYEALIRGPSDSPLHAPAMLFDTAQRQGRLAELDLLCREVAIARFGALQLPGKLFVNVMPAAILSDDFQNGKTREFLLKAGLQPARAVIELTEQQPIDDYEPMREAVEHYRAQGFAVAIDDLGAGYSSLRHWSELRPDYVKIDRHFIQNVCDDGTKRQFVRSILEIARGLGCRVVAEGIETQEEFRALWSMGLELGQGHHIARPRTQPARVLAAPDAEAPPRAPCCRPPFGDCVASLAHRIDPVSPLLTVEETAALFQQDPTLRSVAVVHDERPLGLVQRHDLMRVYARRYGPELNGRKPIVHFARRDPMVVESDMAVEKLSRRITDAPDWSGDEDFIIVDGTGRYVGVGTIMALLRRITELQVRNARYANPLTQLPGNVPINEYIDRLLGDERRFAVTYCDLDCFKPFNDTYGYARGDDVIVALSNILTEHTDPERDFVGHLGGDDFIAVFESGNWEERCRAILERFALAVPWFYSAEHRAQGHIDAVDRRGNATTYGLLSLSIGAVPVEPGWFQSHHEVAVLATEVKKKAKSVDGNALHVDQRDHGRQAPPAGIRASNE